MKRSTQEKKTSEGKIWKMIKFFRKLQNIGPNAKTQNYFVELRASKKKTCVIEGGLSCTLKKPNDLFKFFQIYCVCVCG